MPAPDRPLLRRIDEYLDAVPRAAVRVETIGPFTLFLNEGHGWRYYARPTPGATGITVDDVRVVRERQRSLSQPEAFEWIVELSPDVGEAVGRDRMRVVTHPMMVLSPEDFTPRAPLEGAAISIIGPDDDLAAVNAVAEIAFRNPGTAVSEPGVADATEAARAQNADTLAFQRRRMLAGLTVNAAARVGGVIAAVGGHQPLDGATEIVGVATLPAFRRRGLGAAVTGALVADAIDRGVETICLSADDDDVARVYAGLGFRRVGTTGAAAPRA